MILLFGEHTSSGKSANRSNGLRGKTNPVENSGILAMNGHNSLGFLNASEYDAFVASNPVAINYAAYSEWVESGSNIGFMSEFSNALETLDSGEYIGAAGGGSFAGACSGGSCSSSGGGSFASVC